MPTKATGRAPHEIALVVGRTGSGKTQLISKVLAPRHPRRITIDSVGEGVLLYPEAAVASGLPEVMAVLAQWAEDDVSEWHMIAILSPSETAVLMRTLVPVYQPGVVSMAADMGGVCVECSEVDVYLPVSGAGADVTAAWTTALARGRHVGLSVIAATQRPHQVARIMSSQASRVVAFATHEPRDLRFLRDLAGKQFAAIAQGGLRPYESVHYFANVGMVEVWSREYVRRHRFPAHRVATGQLVLGGGEV